MVKETKSAKKAMWSAQDKYKMLKDRTAWYTKIITEL